MTILLIQLLWSAPKPEMIVPRIRAEQHKIVLLQDAGRIRADKFKVVYSHPQPEVP